MPPRSLTPEELATQDTVRPVLTMERTPTVLDVRGLVSLDKAFAPWEGYE
jgi:hypothetical protein